MQKLLVNGLLLMRIGPSNKVCQSLLLTRAVLKYTAKTVIFMISDVDTEDFQTFDKYCICRNNDLR